MRLRFLALGIALCTLPLAGVAHAAGGAGANRDQQPSSGLQMAMTLYAGGITIGRVDMDAKIVGNKYHVVSNLETSGVVNAFWQSVIQASSSGKIEDNLLQPTLYDSFYTGHNTEKHQEVSLTYENGTPVRLYANPPYSTTGYEVKPEDKKATFDPLSAVVFIASGVGAKEANPCSVLAPVYDGRRRYNIEMRKVKDTTVKMDNGLYKGPAVHCEIKYKQLSGFKPRVLKDANFPLINAWVATFPSAVSGRSYAVPLRVWAQSQYGVVAAVATSFKIDGAAPKGSGG
ncbi:MAG TPA: DUF3108 domain-containing protein [Rhizomicrobium sp.]